MGQAREEAAGAQAEQTKPGLEQGPRLVQESWRLVKGPMAATIATLLDLGWDPHHPTLGGMIVGTGGT